MVLEDKKRWLDRPMKPVTFGILVGLTVLFYLIGRLATSSYDFDMFFLVATGREVAANGIIHVNPWTVDQGLAIVVQQWLYAVITYWFYSVGGHFGMSVFVAVQFAALAFLLWKLMGFGRVTFLGKVAVMSAVCVFAQMYLFSVRPELITLVLLSMECYALEAVSRRGDTRWLFLLPAGMVLEMNLHASMWPFHFCILAAYLVPAFWFPGTKDHVTKGLWKHWKPVAVFSVLMVPAMFLNAYGFDGIMYVVKSYMAGTFSLVNVVELQSPAILSKVGLIILGEVGMAVLARRIGCLSSVSANLLAGFALISMMAERNQMFLVFPLLFIGRDLGAGFQDVLPEYTWRKDMTNALWLVMVIGAVLMGGSCMNQVRSAAITVGYDTGMVETLSAIYDYIEDDGDARVFTGFNTGAYFEYRGLHHIYMDARPEIYMSELNGRKDILAEYARYCTYGIVPYFKAGRMPADWVGPVTKEDMDDWLDGYGFDYLVVSPSAETNLAGYLSVSEDYRMVQECSGNGILLYERRGE